ncbi:MAG: hypothetical protein ACOC1F_09360 [Myxococcota bacterium]
MAHKKSNKDKESKSDKKKGKKSKSDKNKPANPHAEATVAPSEEANPSTEPEAEASGPQEILTHEDALAMAEALVEMVNDGATDPVAFFVSGNDPLGRELIRLQGGDIEEMEGLVPVVLDAPQVRRFGMLTIADELMWRNRNED